MGSLDGSDGVVAAVPDSTTKTVPEFMALGQPPAVLEVACGGVLVTGQKRSPCEASSDQAAAAAATSLPWLSALLSPTGLMLLAEGDVLRRVLDFA